MYPEEMVLPMREDLVSEGFTEFKTTQDVDAYFENAQGTALVVFNSVCGCAAGAARPGVKYGLQKATKKPDQLFTAFAGVDKEAVERARSYTLPFPPSSPSVALFKDGKLIHFVERHHIEGNSAEAIGNHLAQVFDEMC